MSLVLTLFEKFKIDYKETKNGQEIQIQCPSPDHRDRHASCFVNAYSGSWYCFGCGRGGNLKQLAHLLNGGEIDLSEMISQQDILKFKIQKVYKESVDSILSYDSQLDFEILYNKIAVDFVPALESKESREYLQFERKFTEETIKKFKLMYATNGEYEQRVIIPYYKDGKIIGFNSRLIGASKRQGKDDRYRYLINQSKFDDYIYNIENINGDSMCILVEGPFDLMYLSQMGYKNVISTLNTRVSFSHIQHFIQFKKIVICFDNDPETQAGYKATLKAAQKIFNIDELKEVYMIQLPEGKDPNDCLREELSKSFSSMKRLLVKKKQFINRLSEIFQSLENLEK
jgi:DNA primase